MVKRVVSLVLGLAALSGTATAGMPTTAPKPATLQFVAGYNALVGISYGIDAVDADPKVLDGRRTASLPSGVHTVRYSCPNAAPRDGASITFDFAEGKVYELVCRAGQEAEIREGGC